MTLRYLIELLLYFTIIEYNIMNCIYINVIKKKSIYYNRNLPCNSYQTYSNIILVHILRFNIESYSFKKIYIFTT